MGKTNNLNNTGTEPDKAIGNEQGEGLNLQQKLEQDIANLQKEKDALAKHYNLLLVQKDKIHKARLTQLEQLFINSWKWKIGNLVIKTLIRCINFVKNPLRFIARKDYRGSWHGSNDKGSVIKSIRVEEEDNAILVNQTPPVAPAVPKSKKLSPIKRLENKPVIAAVFDEFTSACFQPELTMITFRPDNWREKLEKQTPEAVFVESAWNGNQGAWQYKIAKYQRNMGDEVIDLLNWAKEKHIPTIFWNKEDPPNFDRFIEKASLFDYIFTSDEDCIPKYKEHIKHNRIFSLPFAAQPAIHSPIGEISRRHNVCFAGTYHADEYIDRQNDMEIILNPSLDYGLHIFDRNFGAVGPGSDRFRFPDKYQPYIKGRLNYEEMVKAYHQYKVFLNVNSVKESPTMFSRRVFELLAVGTPVISTYSKGIVELLGDAVFITESEADTRKHLEYLLNDRLAWIKASVKGIRKVMESHTYDKRLEQVFSKVGIKYNPVPFASISLIIRINQGDSLSEISEKILSQTYKPKYAILLSEQKLDKESLESITKRLYPIVLINLLLNQDHLSDIIQESAPTAYYAFWDPMNWYGPEYLKDYALAMKYTNSPYLGKNNLFVLEKGKIREENPEKRFMLSHSVPLSTLMLKSEKLSTFDMELLNNPDNNYESFTSDILVTDPLNFIKNQDRTSDQKLINIENYFG